MTFIIYARKSTEQAERQAMSIPAQIRELSQMVEGLGFKIEETFTEEMSAKKRGRPEFGKMLKYLSKRKDCVLVAWKCDRIARNNFDGAEIVDLLQEGNIKEIRTIDRTFTNNASDLYNLMQEFGMGKKYSDQLSVDVKRGNRQKLAGGGWPHIAPFGYINDRANKKIIIDEQEAKCVVRLFDLYSQGNKSFKEISDILFDEMLRSKSGKKLYPSMLHRIIQNPFHYGVMLRDGKYYQGNHEPIISKQIFDTAQDVLHGKKDSRKTERFYPYRSFMTCAECGCVLTGDTKKGKYVYYFCTNGKGNCEQHKKYMASKKADELMANCFDSIYLDEKLIEIAYQASKEKLANKENSNQELADSIDKRLRSVQERKSRLIDMYLDNGMQKVDYESKTNELQLEILDLENQKLNISKRIGNAESTLELTKEVFLTASKAKKEFLNANNEKRCIALEELLSNLVVRSEEMASVSFKMPYEILKNHPKNGDFQTLLGMRDSNPLGHSIKKSEGSFEWLRDSNL